MKADFRAYRYRPVPAPPELILATWAVGDGAIALERAVYQRRLDRHDFDYVNVSYSEPLKGPEVMKPHDVKQP